MRWPVQRCRDVGVVPTGARLGKDARDGTALVCGSQGTLPFGQGFTRAERLCVRGQGADTYAISRQLCYRWYIFVANSHHPHAIS